MSHSTAQEESRLNAHVNRNLGTATRAQPNLNVPFHLDAQGLPAAPGQPVQIYVDNKKVYDSGDANGDVQTSITVPVTDLKEATLAIRLNIGVMGFDQTWQISRADGHYFKLIGSDQGLQKKQQTKPW